MEDGLESSRSFPSLPLLFIVAERTRISDTVNMTNDTNSTAPAIHAFEKAGLGKAPFRFVRSYVSKYQACQGAPVQNGSSCDFCATSIAQVYVIRGADGREFKVGCECVRRTNDRALVSAARRALARQRRDAVNAKAAELVAKAAELLEREDVREALAAQPHAKIEGRSALEHVEYLLKYGGRAGKTRGAKMVLAAAVL